MSGLSHVIRKSALILCLLAGGVIFTSCASVPGSESTNQQALPKAQLNNQMADTAAPAAPTEASEKTVEKLTKSSYVLYHHIEPRSSSVW